MFLSFKENALSLSMKLCLIVSYSLILFSCSSIYFLSLSISDDSLSLSAYRSSLSLYSFLICYSLISPQYFSSFNSFSFTSSYDSTDLMRSYCSFCFLSSVTSLSTDPQSAFFMISPSLLFSSSKSMILLYLFLFSSSISLSFLFRSEIFCSLISISSLSYLLQSLSSSICSY